MFAALYWEEPDRTGHAFGPDNTTAMAKALKEVKLFGYDQNLREAYMMLTQNKILIYLLEVYMIKSSVST